MILRVTERNLAAAGNMNLRLHMAVTMFLANNDADDYRVRIWRGKGLRNMIGIIPILRSILAAINL